MKRMTCLVLAATTVSIFGSQPVEAASPVECQQFTDFAMRINGNYQKARCPATPLMHGDRQKHYQWCLARPTKAVLNDQHAKQIAFDRCTAPARHRRKRRQRSPSPRPVRSNRHRRGPVARGRARARRAATRAPRSPSSTRTRAAPSRSTGSISTATGSITPTLPVAGSSTRTASSGTPGSSWTRTAAASARQWCRPDRRPLRTEIGLSQ